MKIVGLSSLEKIMSKLKNKFAALKHTHKLEDITDFVVNSSSVTGKVLVYTRPTNIPISSGTQIICYCSDGGTFTFTFGDATFIYESTGENDVGWFLWIQTSENKAGSIIQSNGIRTYLVTNENTTDVGINFTPNSSDTNGSYIVTTIGYGQ